MRKIKIRCKTCNKVLGGFEIDGQVNFDFTCPRCKQKNIGIIKDYNREKIKFINKIDHNNKRKLLVRL